MWKTIAKAKRKALNKKNKTSKTRPKNSEFQRNRVAEPWLPLSTRYPFFVHAIPGLCQLFPTKPLDTPTQQLSTVLCLAMSYLRIPHCTAGHSTHYLLARCLLIHIQILRIRPVKLNENTERHFPKKN